MGSNFMNGPGTPFTPQIMQQYDIIPQGLSAEEIAANWKIGRQELDELAFRSHNLAAKATEAGWFRQEILPLPSRLEDGTSVTHDRDEGIRYNPSLEVAMARGMRKKMVS